MLFIICALSGLVSTALARSGGFLRPASYANETDAFLTASSLSASLDAVLRSNKQEKRLRLIEAAIFPTYLAVPKNRQGRLEPQAVRHVVNTFFRQEHGWIINGMQTSDIMEETGVHDALVLKALALEAREAGRGLSLEEVAALSAALERLILDESVALLQVAYQLNGMSVTDMLERKQLHEVLISYLIVHIHRTKLDYANQIQHEEYKRLQKEEGGTVELDEFAEDAVRNFDFSQQTSGLGERKYSFHAASSIVEAMAHAYSRWQIEDCGYMREALESMDSAGAGTVPYESFRSYPATDIFVFSESQDQLRALDVLDESAPARPAVRISNYLLSESNCNPRGSYYVVCCMNPCTSIMSELEGHFKAPFVDPQPLLDFVSNLSSRWDFDQFKTHGEELRSRLWALSKLHEGKVPLHSRLFEQWLHFSFPRDCPHPRQSMEEKGSNRKWSEMEALPLLETHRRSWQREAFASVMNAMVLLAFVAAIVRILMQGFHRIAALRTRGSKFETGSHLAMGKFV